MSKSAASRRRDREGAELNKYQQLLLKAYPAVELIGFDWEDPKAVDQAVRSPDGSGDRLFDFLWLELLDCETDIDASERIDSAVRDLNALLSRVGG